jgi:hypothetical protein
VAAKPDDYLMRVLEMLNPASPSTPEPTLAELLRREETRTGIDYQKKEES